MLYIIIRKYIRTAIAVPKKGEGMKKNVKALIKYNFI